MAGPIVDQDSFNALSVLSGELGALNDSIPKLIEAVNQLTQLLSGKTGIFKLLLKEHEAKQPQAQPSEQPSNSIKISDLSDVAQEWLIPHPKGFAMKKYDPSGDAWSSINDELQAVAIATKKTIRWIKAGKDSHWEVS